ncbi:DAPG hydrolase family protein [Chitinophaga nivalis]|uniref:DAPG hydrolase PhiG domain-containing protein n=1 Tax=Chitinophaga nivalis TaxID=2991709 RepID=A0ABT3IMP0_9BACT|nr:hypothetical protein [Chitinophaga nivalis]MCW3465089.1 hypothetical protein [Chitinophaga nivalis]MCW3485219.1 hypothetical protein [Chitinophaga nivalis]
MKTAENPHAHLFTDINALLSRKPLPIETGIQRLSNGMLLVSVRTEMPGCKSRMADWWFKFFETTQHIKWWHPHDHVTHSGWDEHWKKGESYVGATIHATEALGDIPPVAATIKFHDPAELFDPQQLDAAYTNNEAGAVVYARIGFGDHVKIDAKGDPLDGYMVHVFRDTATGCVLRSRFYLGASAKDPIREIPDELGLGLMVHCYSEFTYLSRFIPSLYYAENKTGDKAPLPW